jgi:putative hydroxymethylpyrimidine transport system substrate-binding protein
MKKIILFLVSLVTSISVTAVAHPQKLTVLLDWFPNPDHAPLIVAQQQGYFKEQELDVELIGPASPTDSPKWIAAHKADIGITYEPAFIEQVDRGLPLIRIGRLIDKPLNCLVTLKDSGIKTLADFKGKHIGASDGGLTSTMLKVMLAKQGLTDKDTEIIHVRYNLTQALLSHKVDAVTGLMRNYEVPQLELNGYKHKVVSFFPEDNGIPNYSELIFITNTSHANDKRFPGFLKAIKKAVVYLDAHPQQTWEQYAKQYPESNNEVNHEAWFATMPYFAEDPADFNSEEWQHFAQFMQENHLIKKIQPMSRYAVILR